ncbi:unnamed protein product [Zymoseptoria tritici ST99CH_1A5]|nr:unnamed protein product [Zymoseptoria tritici ST99CH_1A5]
MQPSSEHEIQQLKARVKTLEDEVGHLHEMMRQLILQALPNAISPTSTEVRGDAAARHDTSSPTRGPATSTQKAAASLLVLFRDREISTPTTSIYYATTEHFTGEDATSLESSEIIPGHMDADLLPASDFNPESGRVSPPLAREGSPPLLSRLWTAFWSDGSPATGRRSMALSLIQSE